jgi:hypothetical protein
VNRKELSDAIAEAAARTERAAALQQEARARQEAATARLEELEARREGEEVSMRRARARQEKVFQDHVRRMEKLIVEDKKWTKRIFAELDDQRDERRALLEALFRVMDRLPPAAS